MFFRKCFPDQITPFVGAKIVFGSYEKRPTTTINLKDRRWAGFDLWPLFESQNRSIASNVYPLGNVNNQVAQITKSYADLAYVPGVHYGKRDEVILKAALSALNNQGPDYSLMVAADFSPYSVKLEPRALAGCLPKSEELLVFYHDGFNRYSLLDLITLGQASYASEDLAAAMHCAIFQRAWCQGWSQMVIEERWINDLERFIGACLQ